MTPSSPSSTWRKPRRKRIEAFRILIWIINIISALSVIVLVLLQHGRDMDAGATFDSDSGSTQGVLGSAGNANFLSRSTTVTATLFFATCMAVMYIHTHPNKHGLDFNDVKRTQQAPEPATPTQDDTIPVTPDPQQQ